MCVIVFSLEFLTINELTTEKHLILGIACLNLCVCVCDIDIYLALSIQNSLFSAHWAIVGLCLLHKEACVMRWSESLVIYGVILLHVHLTEQ